MRLFLLFCFLVIFSARTYAADYRLITGYLPPWSMIGQKDHPGSLVELMREAVKRAGHSVEIEVLPWGRAQSLATSQPNVIIFPMTRLVQRENLYQWVAPIKVMQMAFISLKGGYLTEEKAKTLSRVLVHENAPPQIELTRRGFNNLVPIHDISPLVMKMMEVGRFDAWFSSLDMAYWVFKNATDRSTLSVGETLSVETLYLAASKNTDTRIIKELKVALDEMHDDGTFQHILARYRPEE